MMQIVPSWWLYAINISTQVKNWSTRSPFSISPIIVGTNRLVDPEDSPAFKAIAKSIANINHGILGETIPQLQSRLKRLFAQGKASPWDTDVYGRTILSVGKPVSTCSLGSELT